MADPTWGSLAKAQDDPETIEEAIQRFIDNHEADSEAHLGAGEALETHRAQETIDHPAGSVVGDKVVDNIFVDKTMVNMYQSLDSFWGSGYIFTNTLKYIRLITSNVLANEAAMYLIASYDTEVAFADSPVLEVSVRFSFGTGNNAAYIGMGDMGYDFGNAFVGFQLFNGHLYAYSWDGFTDDPITVDLGAITSATKYLLRIEYYAGDRVDFYINGEFQTTITTALPDAEAGFWLFARAVCTQVNKQVGMYIGAFTYYYM